jgi:hypothetical protein
MCISSVGGDVDADLKAVADLTASNCCAIKEPEFLIEWHCWQSLEMLDMPSIST